MADVPYVGCGVLSSGVRHGQGGDEVPLCSGGIADLQNASGSSPQIAATRCESNPAKFCVSRCEIGLPCFVKPANLGSSRRCFSCD